MFDKITIIGCGLIGSSILRVVDKKKLSKQIIVFLKVYFLILTNEVKTYSLSLLSLVDSSFVSLILF